HKRYILIAVLAIAVIVFSVWERGSKDTPDCSVAMVVRFTPTSDEIAALQDALESVCPDVNGDGEVSVALNVIRIDYLSMDLDDAAVMDMTANVDKLNADFYTRQSGIFLLDDPASFQAAHEALSYLDGSTPPEGAREWEKMALPWSQCEAVKDITFMAGDTGGLWFARRMILNDEDQQAFTGAEALWTALF
ncbi:MAG: hypothetical protein K2O18_14755, partial [Oscillospiraceae bacterium]|nr:hypothetical protein [Oscillospiraceae bacterium]